MVNGARPRFYYATPDRVRAADHHRLLQPPPARRPAATSATRSSKLRAEFGLEGTPLRVRFDGPAAARLKRRIDDGAAEASSV